MLSKIFSARVIPFIAGSAVKAARMPRLRASSVFSSSFMHQRSGHSSSLFRVSSMSFSTKKPDFDEGEQAAMASAKDMLSSIEESVVELKSYDEWADVVMKSKNPVILDCYADWCGPCQQLTPLLEEEAIKANGKFKLVKLNIDELPDIANGLSVRSIPAVFLVSEGNVMDTFVGVPNSERLKDFINTAKLLEQLKHDDKTIEQIIIAAEDHVRSGDYHSASEIFRQSLSTAKLTEDQTCKMYLYVAFCYAKLGDDMQAREWHAKWHGKFRTHTLNDEQQKILDQYEHTMEELKANEAEDEVLTSLMEKYDKISADPLEEGDNKNKMCQVMFDIANRYISKDKHADSIDYLIDILAIDRNWNESAAMKLLMEVFAKLGTNNEIVIQSRRKMAKILF